MVAQVLDQQFVGVTSGVMMISTLLVMTEIVVSRQGAVTARAAAIAARTAVAVFLMRRYVVVAAWLLLLNRYGRSSQL